ncbi:MAG TPA: geranylgeranylglyceryl/heptaprenylglyceryl phosphate synthase [Bacteroidales bacterium]|nr:geranylgeranylglyceryl/heptaprenylglyceryl phosphate synthase [Bacteroidales bacterium]
MDKKETLKPRLVRGVGVLLDPDKFTDSSLKTILQSAHESKTDYILVGGSLSSVGIDILIDRIKEQSQIPVILFPGNLLQINVKADIILFLSLISGRNPEFLIGNHVIAAPFLKDHRRKIVPVGYILVNCGTKTSVEYMSHTDAIPCDKTEIVVATALAGEMLGLKMIYLEAGSGSTHHIPLDVISAVRQNVSIPIIAGGGIRNEEEAEAIFKAGADMIVLGNGCEKDPGLLARVCAVRDKLATKNDPLT